MLLMEGRADSDFLRAGDFGFLTDFYRLTSEQVFLSKAAMAWVGKTGAEGTIFRGLSSTFDFSSFFCEPDRGFYRLCDRCEVHPEDR